MSGDPARIGFLLSGSGRTLENLAKDFGDRARARSPLARIEHVVSSRSDVRGVEIARSIGVPCTIEPCRTPEDSLRIFQLFDDENIDLAVLGGFLRRIVVPPSWRGRVVNIHPSLLPKYGGKGCYGDRVHAAVIAAGDTESGCTVHFVDDEYDHGQVILQTRVPVEPDDTTDSLAARVFEAECTTYPKAIEMMLRGETKLEEPGS